LSDSVIAYLFLDTDGQDRWMIGYWSGAFHKVVQESFSNRTDAETALINWSANARKPPWDA
jgi:hypothetical protein